MDRKCLLTDTDTTDNNISMAGAALQVEEFECGLSVQGAASEKQEWAFTLYDFDGGGKVTKEDLGQLLKSLYDAVGSTINLPPEGTKSLKLKLTVSPDKTKAHSLEIPRLGNFPDLNRTEFNEDKEQKHSPKKTINTELNNGSVQSVNPKLTVSRTTKVEVRNNLSKMHKDTRMPASKKRLSTTEQRQLADLVQYNMQQNYQKYNVLRNQQRSSLQTDTARIPKRCNRTSLENPDRRNYYLDLAGIENPATTSLLNTSLPEPMPSLMKNTPRRRHAKSKSKSRTTDQNINMDQVKSQRSKVNGDSVNIDVPVEDSEEGTVGPPHIEDLPSDMEPLLPCSQMRKSTPSKRGKQCRQSGTPVEAVSDPPPATINTPKELSPHHRRHKNHARAMQQVAQWIEKEQLLKCKREPPIVVERHEHHHIHEHHHHHHYHHYHASS